mmetsp:Transcript_22229/g.44759  ORF Transcript_22229/g.44759 Transcript_22229/m.44759 type:complete len:627 (+) Transcript_22229:56-1936(+)
MSDSNAAPASWNRSDSAKPNLQSALGFLRQVKEAMPAEYDTFLDVLTQFRAKNVAAQSVVTVVVEMLIGREYLLEGFSQFLPPACRDCLLERFTQKPDADSAEDEKSVKEDKSPTGSDVKQKKCKLPSSKANSSKKAGSATSFDPADLLVAEMPVERKRKREGLGEMDLRPNALLGSYKLFSRRANQPHIYQAQLKKDLTPPNLDEVWKELEQQVNARVEQVLKEGENWIPFIDYDDILHDRVDAKTIERIKIAGVLKVRNTLSRETAEDYNRRMMRAMKHYFNVDPCDHQSYSSIYNDTNPKTFTLGGVQELYYTHPQTEARQHPNMDVVRRWLNRLWSHVDKETQEVLCLPELETTYIDRWRHRLPRYDRQTGMKEHMDNGGMSRWAHPAWQQVYGAVLGGRLSEFDPWEVGRRASVSSSVFRTFQGWLALTPQGPRDGSLEVVPLLAEAISYVMLRPLRGDVPAHQLCGVNDLGGSETLEITNRWHGPLLRGKLSVGQVQPGDTVWWHPDVIHGVESEHCGEHLSNVLYIPSAPMCPLNARCLRRQREAFEQGNAPPGFPNLRIERQSAEFRSTEKNLSSLGRQQMGFDPFPPSALDDSDGQLAKKEAMLAECNEILFADDHD